MNRLIKKIKHIGCLLIGHIILYSLYQLLIDMASGYSPLEAVSETLSYFSVKAFAKAIVIGTGFMGGGEWFLVSLLEAYIVMGLLFQHERIRKTICRFAIPIAAALLFAHIFLRAAVIKLGVTGIGAFSFLASYSVRNTWFDAIPFMLIGMAIRKDRKILIQRPAIAITAALALSIVESLVLKYVLGLGEMGTVLYVGTVLAVTIAMIYATSHCGHEDILSQIGEKLSMLVYFLHPIVGWTMQNAMGAFGIGPMNIVQDIAFSVGVMIVTTLVSVAVAYVKTHVVRRA